jgi:putative ABC transport system permease protein
MGAALALPVAWWLFWGTRSFQLPGGIRIALLDLTLDIRTVIACVAIGGIATLMIAALTATFGFSADLADALRSRANATPRLTHNRTRGALVIGQVAVALVLLSGAGLFARSLIAAMNLNAGLDTKGVIMTPIGLGQYRGRYDPVRAAAFFEDLSNRLASNPAIESLAYKVQEGGMTSAGQLMIDGQARKFPSTVWITTVSPDYFRMMRIPLISGRDFSKDDRENGKLAVIVSESFGWQLANGRSPLGARVQMPYSKVGQKPPEAEVVGVVGDVVSNVSVAEPLDMYFAIAQMAPVLSRTLAVRPAGDLDRARREIVSAIREIDPIVTPGPIQTLEEGIISQMGPQTFGVSVMGALGSIAALLTLLGTYVLAESLATSRYREIGIRAALGANRAQLAGIVFKETFRLTAVGIVIGLFLSWAGAGTIRSLLFRVKPLDPLTIGTVCAGMLIVAIAVSLRPALRAANVNISRILREE